MHLSMNVLPSLNRYGSLCYDGPPHYLILLGDTEKSLTTIFLAYRYAKAFPFTNKNQQKEMIETKVVKDEKIDDCNSNDESKKFDKNPDDPKSLPKTTVRCLEAEV